jgi:integrase
VVAIETERDRVAEPVVGRVAVYVMGTGCRTQYRGTAYDKRAKRHLRGQWTYSLAEARAWRVDAMQGLQAGTKSATQGPTVREAAEQFLTGIESGTIRDRSGRRYKRSTVRGYAADLRQHVIPAFGAARLNRLTRAEIQLWIDSLDGAPNTVRNRLTALQAVLAWAAPRGLIHVNPARDLRLPSGETPRERIATPDEAAALIAALPPRDQAALGLMFYAGLRRGEALALDTDHVEPTRVHVERTWDPTGRAFTDPKHGSKRTVPVCDELAALLADHRVLTNHAPGLLFASSRRPGQPIHPSPLYRNMYAAWDDAGMERLTPHEARHSYASLSAAAGIGIEKLSRRMGHSSIQVTWDRYGHLYRDSEDDERDLLNAYIAGRRTHGRTHDDEEPHG